MTLYIDKHARKGRHACPRSSIRASVGVCVCDGKSKPYRTAVESGCICQSRVSTVLSRCTSFDYGTWPASSTNLHVVNGHTCIGLCWCVGCASSEEAEVLRMLQSYTVCVCAPCHLVCLAPSSGRALLGRRAWGLVSARRASGSASK